MLQTKQMTSSVLGIACMGRENGRHPCSGGNTWYAQSGGLTARKRELAEIATDHEVACKALSILARAFPPLVIRV
jgi:hypothetical protein